MSAQKKSPRPRASLPSASARRLYQIKITLLEVEPPVWRRFQILSDATLADLRLAVQIIMGWEDSHLDEFTLGREVYTVPRATSDRDREEESGKDAGRVRLASVLPKPGQPFHYTYDFGDSWEHELVVEKTLPCASHAVSPRCLDGARACPPEDCGGPWGYADMLEVLADPDHEERADQLEWVGEDFDPEKFSADAVNKELRHYFKLPSHPGPRRA